MRLRVALVAAASAVLTAAATAPASAHEELTPKTFPVGEATFLALTVANESTNDLVRLALQAPTGVGLGSSARTPEGWTRTSSAGVVTWSGGPVRPDTFEIFGFELAPVDQPGPLTFKLTLEYRQPNGDSETDVHQIDVTAVASGAATPSSAPSPTTVSTGAAAVPSRADEESGGGTSEETPAAANAALALSIVSLLMSAGTLAVVARRRGGPAGGTGSEGPTAAQDW